MVDTRLNTLLTVIETGSYTKAAVKLSLTQPAVSQHIKSLEEEFEVDIFYKSTRKARLTPEGRILEKYAQRENALYQNLLSDLETSRNGIRRFVIGVTPSAEETVVPKMLASYSLKYPDVRITVISDTIKNIYRRINNYEIDLGIVEGNVHDDGLTSLMLDTDYLCLIVSPEHPFARKRSVTLNELKTERLIVRPVSAGTRRMLEGYLYGCSENLNNFRISMEIDNVSTIKDLVRENLGVSIIAHSACAQEERSGKLKVIPIENFRTIREINIVYRKDFRHEEILNELCQIYLNYRGIFNKD